MGACPGNVLNDLFLLDPYAIEWAEVTNELGGQLPTATDSLGFIATNRSLVVFGGRNTDGESLAPSSYEALLLCYCTARMFEISRNRSFGPRRCIFFGLIS